jgi:hypothetical protein
MPPSAHVSRTRSEHEVPHRSDVLQKSNPRLLDWVFVLWYTLIVWEMFTGKQEN